MKWVKENSDSNECKKVWEVSHSLILINLKRLP